MIVRFGSLTDIRERIRMSALPPNADSFILGSMSAKCHKRTSCGPVPVQWIEVNDACQNPEDC
jgi:hypothetical protein